MPRVVLLLCHSTYSTDRNGPSNLGPHGRMDTRLIYLIAAAEISRRSTVVGVQYAAQTLAALHCSTMTRLACLGHDQPVAKTLVVALAMVMQQELTSPCAQRALPEDGWMKQVGGMRKAKLRGLWKVGWQFLMTAAAFNLWRIPKLRAAQA